MQARGMLMIEHRLIERMIALIGKALGRIRSEGKADPLFIDTAVDFFRIYADRTHHGKEEDIFFRDLDLKDLSSGDRRMMDGLIEDHASARVTIDALASANARYRNGESAALAEISGKLNDLLVLYPKHIEREDKVFFPASRAYLTEDEDRAMQAEFQELDRKIIHEKYKSVLEALEG